ncbi:multi-domain regulatory protein [Leifsonia rubra CMS 76R]|nr:multi-domain regulatory protein [Leifsonia rubra CMS 76R]
MMIDFLALGPVKVCRDGQDFPLGGATQRALLARLAVARGRPIAPSRLCDELWRNAELRDPTHALQARVSRLRSALPLLKIDLVNGGYCLDPLHFRSDTVRFEQLREESGSMLAEGHLAQASEHLLGALALWRGPAFADVTDVSALRAESARLEQLRESALADRIDIDLALGRESEVTPELAALVEECPLIERHWGQLMTALYRQGHASEALDVYARARTMSENRLGAEPSGELGQLHLRILREQPSELLLRFPAAKPIKPEPLAADPQRSAKRVTINSNDSDALMALVHQQRGLIVTGPEGFGKTHLLRALRSRFEAQHWSAPLLSASTLSRSIPLGVFAGTVGSFADGSTTPAALLESFTRHRSTTVLLVDNVGLLDDASLFVVTQLISTSRVPTVVVAESITDAPTQIRALYDSGELTEVAVEKLSDVEVHELAVSIVGGPLTPDSRVSIVGAASGNPLRVREIVSGSLSAGKLIQTTHGWELRGSPVPSPRLAQLVGARFEKFDDASVESLSLVAIAGEYPGEALAATQRRFLARADVLALSDSGWLRLADPLDREVLRARCPEVLWNELTREVVQVLTSDLASGLPQAKLRAQILALELGDPIDIPTAILLAEHALGAFDERLALHAAEAVVEQDPANVHAYRLAGIAASALRMPAVVDAHFSKAHLHSASDPELSAVALAHAHHCGVRLHDAVSALAIIERALSVITSSREVEQLQRARMRWTAVAGMSGERVPPPALSSEAADALGLITVGLSGVITGPLEEAHTVLAQLQQVPKATIDLVPGGASLIALIEIMALSNSGDIIAVQHQLRQKITESTAQEPESLGQWEYALGFSELFSGDAVQAYTYALAAVEHLEWRDSAGLLPAAQVLAAATALVTGCRSAEVQLKFDAIPEVAGQDPKVVMLRSWAEARIARAEGRGDDAARTLVEAGWWLLSAQHTYFAGMLAHCVVRTGWRMGEAMAILRETNTIAGGGLLALFVRHGAASMADDGMELNQIAREARELGLVGTAADIWTCLVDRSDDDVLPDRLQRQRAATEQLLSEKPALVSWLV